jgi:hypothetical protein
MSKITITKALASKVLEVVDKGLTDGLDDGDRSIETKDGYCRPAPGHMCVEAAVCYALGEDHDDRPSCVYGTIREIKIQLNDSDVWKSEKDRAKQLRRLAIAQLGSKETFKSTASKIRLEKLLKGAIHKHIISNLVIEDEEPGSYWTRPDFTELAPISLENYLKSKVDVEEDVEHLLGGSYDFSLSRKELIGFAEELVQILVKFKVPGTKFLYLTEK